jgi:hypothetical protein
MNGENYKTTEQIVGLLFGRCPVRVSTRASIIVTEDLHPFPHSIQTNSRLVP